MRVGRSVGPVSRLVATGPCLPRGWPGRSCPGPGHRLSRSRSALPSMTICSCPFVMWSWTAPAWKRSPVPAALRRVTPQGGQAPDQAKTSGPGRCRPLKGRVKRRARLPTASVSESDLMRPAPACRTSPVEPPQTPSVLFVGRCLGQCGPAKSILRPVWSSMRSWWNISLPWSQRSPQPCREFVDAPMRASPTDCPNDLAAPELKS
jgi:hypothetical protein